MIMQEVSSKAPLSKSFKEKINSEQFSRVAEESICSLWRNALRRDFVKQIGACEEAVLRTDTFGPRASRLTCSSHASLFVAGGYSNPAPKRLD